MQILHFVDALYHLVYFWSGWYWLFVFIFSALFGSFCKAGLVARKCLSNLLNVKDFICPSCMKLSLAAYEILSWKLFSFRMFNNPC